MEQPAASSPPPSAAPNPTPPPNAAPQAEDPGITIPFKWIIVGSVALIAGGVFYVVTRKPAASAPGNASVHPDVLRSIGRQPALPSGLPSPSDYRTIMRRMQEQLRALGYAGQPDQAIASFLHDHPTVAAMQREVVAAIDRAFGERFPSS
ncbi:MAG: hypothetical protein ABI652_00930 [Acidobacteriota bacterium]